MLHWIRVQEWLTLYVSIPTCPNQHLLYCFSTSTIKQLLKLRQLGLDLDPLLHYFSQLYAFLWVFQDSFK